MNVVIDGQRYVPVPEVQTDNALLAALELRFDSDAGDQLTIRDYFFQLLRTLWGEVESFSGKRPFGNSGWTWDIYNPLVAAGYLEGTLDGDGYIEDFDEIAADAFVHKLLLAAFYGVSHEQD